VPISYPVRRMSTTTGFWSSELGADRCGGRAGSERQAHGNGTYLVPGNDEAPAATRR
jgi:hypothetical protein